MSEAPTVLILGGLSHGIASAVLCYLWEKGHNRASHVRLVDKFMILPAQDVFLRWVDPSARKVLKEGHGKGVEYMQGNLQNAETRARIFTPPHGSKRQAYDIVIDLTAGDYTTAGSEEVMRETLGKLPRLNGLEALKNGGVGAYIRWTDSFVTQPKERCPLKENDPEIKPTTPWSKWNMEGNRGLASLKDLNLVIARSSNPWGPGCMIGFTKQLVVGAVYQYLGSKETMEMLWGKDLVLEHIHTYDLASAFYSLAIWQLCTAVTRSKADSLAGAPLSPARPPAYAPGDFTTEHGSSSSSSTTSQDEVEIEGLPKSSETITAPVFHISDGSAATQEQSAKVITAVMGIKIDFYNAITNQLARLHMDEVVEVADEKHTSPWYEMLDKSSPSISNTPLSPSLPESLLRKNRCHLDSTKIRELTGWKPKYTQIEVDEVRRNVEEWKKDGIWPNCKPKSK